MRGPFHNKNFRRLFYGRVVTNIGDSLYFIAAMWLVYDLTGDAFYTGLAGFLTLVPSALQFLAGPLVDRWPIRETLVATQLLQGAIILVIPAAHYFDVLSVGVVLVVMPLLALCNQIVYPAQTTALPRLLDDDELVDANSAFSVAYQGLDSVANGASGILIGMFGAITMFMIDAVTFVVAALVFATVAIPTVAATGDDSEGEDVVSTDGGEATADDDADSYLYRLRTGTELIQGTFLVRLLVGVSLLNFLSGFALATLPVYAERIPVPSALSIVAGAGAYGILMAAFSSGNFLGSLGASVVDDRPLGWTMIVGLAVSGTTAIAAIAVHWLPLTAVLFVFVFLPFGVINVQLSALVQSVPPKEYVGRVSSVLGSASSVSTPFGALAGGIAGSAFGPRFTMYGLGVGGLLLAGYVLGLSNLRTLPSVGDIELEMDSS